jgi:hypothetical protein
LNMLAGRLMWPRSWLLAPPNNPNLLITKIIIALSLPLEFTKSLFL